MAGSLTVFTGGMFAEKSTALIREGKRHIIAGRNVVILKPEIDNRYSEDAVVTHDGVVHKAVTIGTSTEMTTKQYLQIIDSDVVCIDEIQFFNEKVLRMVDALIYKGKQVYVAGLDMDRFGKPFGIMPHLMARAEHVKKFHAVCQYCGDDAWVTLGTEETKDAGQVVVTSEFVPACRTCAEKVGGIK